MPVNRVKCLSVLLHGKGKIFNSHLTYLYNIYIHPSSFRLTYVDCLMQISPERYIETVLMMRQYPIICELKQAGLGEFKLNTRSCDFSNHVYPGYHIAQFKKVVLNKKVCLGNYYVRVNKWSW